MFVTLKIQLCHALFWAALPTSDALNSTSFQLPYYCIGSFSFRLSCGSRAVLLTAVRKCEESVLQISSIIFKLQIIYIHTYKYYVQ